MTNRFYSPFQQFFDSTPTPRAGSRLFFYAAGTSTKQNTYSNATLVTANDNPLTLNALGQPDTDIYLSDLPYKVVLAPPGSDDPPNTTLFSADNYYLPPTTAKFNSGSGNPNGSVAGTAGSVGVPASVYWDYSNAVLYVCTSTGIAAAAVWTAATLSVPPATPQGRLTLTTGTPIISVGVSAATSVYYTPAVGNRIPIYDGTVFTNYQFAELTLSLVSNHTANLNYDVFVFSNSGVVTIGTGPAWSVSTLGGGGRGAGAATTELTRVQGLPVNNVSITARNGSNTYTVAANKATYVGTLRIDGTNGQVTCNNGVGQGTAQRWGVWNAYNRHRTVMQSTNNNLTWTYTSATIRQAGNDATNNITFIQGLLEDSTSASYGIRAQPAAGGFAVIGIGVNQSTAYASMQATAYNSVKATLTAPLLKSLPLGANTLYPVESTDGVNGSDFVSNSGADGVFSVEFFA